NGVKQRMSAAEVSMIVVEGVKDAGNPVTVRYHIRVPQYAQRTGTRLFFQPGFFQHGLPQIFESESRKFSIYFHYPWSEEDDVAIDLPTGFDLDAAESPGVTRAADVASQEILLSLSQDRAALLYKRRLSFGLNGAILFAQASYKDLKMVFDTFHQR